MDTSDAPFSRISKLLVDRDETSIEDALTQRQRYAVTLSCGNDVAQSYTLQLAVLTAANIATRCFPGAVRLALASGLAEAPLLVWPSLKQTFGQALSALVGPDALMSASDTQAGRIVLFGNAATANGALRITFDGWIAKVGPVTQVERLPEREYCSLAGILAAALAMSELFLAFADISVEAGRRVVALSLWKPDIAISDPSALGVPVEFLPRNLWMLGLGHLGNAYLWSVASLPYSNANEVELFLNDFDPIEDENVETSLLFDSSKVGRYKTRACNEWLEQRGFQTRLIERPFDANFRRRDDEPGLALCGFDSNPARRDLATAQFLRVVESGLGGTANNFDTISLHTFPNPRPPAELWPDLTPAEAAKLKEYEERLARENAGYARVGGDECGRYQLAGKSIAVPFVGGTAATLVIAETLRLLHRGPAYSGIKLAMAALHARAALTSGSYSGQDFVGLKYTSAQLLQLR
jgi:hypothetical protein